MRLMSLKKYTSTAAIAPTWMTAEKATTDLSSTGGMSMSPSAILRWPVEDTGRNSVTPPSTTPRTTA